MRICRGCGEENPDRARFCLGCGTAFEAAAELRERRVVAALFADLVGFTPLSAQLGPDDMSALQDAYLREVRETVSRYGGRLEKFIGDAAMAVFGLPHANDDDAVRAVQAGIALTNAIERIGARLGLDPDALRLRVGVETGEVVYALESSGEWRVTGDAINLAARLQVAAPPGRVLLGEAAALAVADAIELEPVEPLELKGVSRRVRASLAVAILASRSRDRAVGALRSSLVGRDRELSTLLAVLAAAKGGRAERWVVVAPPGVGKTRLIDEFLVRAAAVGPVHLVWRARCRQGLASPEEPLVELLRAAFATAGLRAGGAQDEAAGILTSALRRVGFQAREAAVLAAHALDLVWPATRKGHTRASPDRQELFFAWSSALGALAARRALWVVEDVHWAGADLLAFLEFAAGHPGRAGRIVLATARTSLLETAPAWCREDAANTHVLRLPPLAQADCEHLVAALVGEALSPELAAAIAQRAGGNPLFVEELLRSWVSAGTLAPVDGGWRLTVPAAEVPVPLTVQSVYAAQLDDLPADAREVARRGAVAGRRFPAEALAGLGIADQAGGIEVLVRRDFVSGPVPDPLLGPSYEFRHALLQEAGYASLPRSAQARLHAGLAEWMEATAGPRARELAELIGDHYAAALDASPAFADSGERLGRDEIATRAAGWFEAAAQANLALGAHEAAIGLFRRALARTPVGDHELLARRRLELAEAQRRGDDLEAAMTSFADAAEAARWVRSLDVLTQAAIGYEDALFSSRLPRAHVGETSQLLLRDALARLEGDSDNRALALAALARAYRYGGAPEQAETAAAESIEMARRLDRPRLLAYALFARRTCLAEPSQLDERRAIGVEMVAAAQRAGEPELEVEARRHLLIDQLEAGAVGDARATIGHLEALIDLLGRPLFLWYPAMWRAMLALFEGRGEEAEQFISAFLAEGRRWQYREVGDVYALQLFLLRRDQGRHAEARKALEPLMAVASPARWLSLSSLSLCELGRREEGVAEFERLAAAGFEGVPSDLSRSVHLALYSEACALIDDRRAATRLLKLLAPWTGLNLVVGSGAACLGSASHFLGRLAQTLGDRVRALAYLQQAWNQNVQMGAWPAASRSGHALGSVLLEGSRRERARGKHLIDQSVEVDAALAGGAGLEVRRLFERVDDSKSRSN